MLISFTYHATLRKRQRRIRKKEILETLENPDVLSVDEGDHFLAFKKYRKRALKIVYVKAKNE